MLSGEGMHLFGDVGHNLGYVLAMLPDMLIGMFTGKARNFRFQDNLLPIACIVAGMFVKKSPLLKMMLIGFGGANLLHNAGEALVSGDPSLKSSKSSPVRQYRSYADEPLDPRLQSPVMKGNTLSVTIDNIPSICTLDDASCDAYYQGKVPLNTLCNAVLRKWDERQQAVSDGYDRAVGADLSVERSRGLK